jgi:hypothetical protein
MCKKWLQLDKKIANEYEAKIIKCKNEKCKRILHPYFVHTDIDSNYTCYICNKDGTIKYSCFHCKHKI